MLTIHSFIHSHYKSIVLLKSYEDKQHENRLYIHVTDEWFDGTGPLACLSPFSVISCIIINSVDAICPFFNGPLGPMKFNKKFIFIQSINLFCPVGLHKKFSLTFES